jgi:hypothetical protein
MADKTWTFTPAVDPFQRSIRRRMQRALARSLPPRYVRRHASALNRTDTGTWAVTTRRAGKHRARIARALARRGG